MEIKLVTVAKESTYTIGKLGINGVYFCDTLEDTYRPNITKETKIKGKTCIPEGSYTVVITKSQRFNRDMPLLLNVPFFEGIRIHSGNTDSDTEGCILVGKNTEKGKITESQKTFLALFEKIRLARTKNEEVIIKVIR